MTMVSIKGLDKAAVLAALYNASQPQGMGWLRAVPGDMTVEQAEKELGTGGDHGRDFGATAVGNSPMYFDYLHGRPLKIDLSTDDLRTDLYDRDNGGAGVAARIIEKLRSQQQQEVA